MGVTITLADIKLNKHKLSIEGLRPKAEKLLASYPGYQAEWLGLSIESMAAYLPS